MGNVESEEKKSDSFAPIIRNIRRTLQGTSSAKGGRCGWYTKHDMNTFLMIVRPGDLIEIERDYYAHWAVCVAVGTEGATVVHFTIDHGIRSAKLGDILENEECRVNNAKDGEYPVNSPKEIVKRANFYLENPDMFGEYNRLINNCEHFATGCRYNRKKSGQVETALKTTAAAVVGVATVVAAIGEVVEANKNRNNSDTY